MGRESSVITAPRVLFSLNGFRKTHSESTRRRFDYWELAGLAISLCTETGATKRPSHQFLTQLLGGRNSGGDQHPVTGRRKRRLMRHEDVDGAKTAPSNRAWCQRSGVSWACGWIGRSIELDLFSRLAHLTLVFVLL